MNDQLNRMSGADYVYPGFARWGIPQAQAMTNWLRNDPANPSASGRLIRIVSRRLLFSGLTTGTSSVATPFRPTNGTNYIMLWRTAEAVTNGGTTALNTSLVNVTQTQSDGTILDDVLPLTTNYGSGEMPYVYVVPDMVLGTATRNFTVTNNTGSTADVYLAFAIAYVD